MTQNTTERAVNDRIVWIDCEMTGLSLERDALIEVAALVTDYELNHRRRHRPRHQASRRSPRADGRLRPDMHTTSGLLADLDRGITLEDAQAQVLTYVREWVPEPRKAPLGGNTVGTDRGFLARDMPELEAHLHYRVIDVSSIKELSRRWYPRAYFNAPKKSGGHRALADIRESIAEPALLPRGRLRPRSRPGHRRGPRDGGPARHRALTAPRGASCAAWQGWSSAPLKSR